jgi:hypothetical protein
MLESLIEKNLQNMCKDPVKVSKQGCILQLRTPNKQEATLMATYLRTHGHKEIAVFELKAPQEYVIEANFPI